ncbi:MAG: type II toxin-antitoxin system YafQ family toxin [Clostridiales bacterium]|jgi:mRNA interferase YafQ|nr:type II toxin-antitoxin system YafQ family toxin [Clostridiales bacterium]
MKVPIYSGQFKKDYKLVKKRGNDVDELKRIFTELIKGNRLPPQNKDHALSGDYQGCRECHVKPDLLVIYQTDLTEITFIRVGTHSDLF